MWWLERYCRDFGYIGITGLLGCERVAAGRTKDYLAFSGAPSVLMYVSLCNVRKVFGMKFGSTCAMAIQLTSNDIHV